jgi:hypothetical protein
LGNNPAPSSFPDILDSQGLMLFNFLFWIAEHPARADK